MTTTTAPVIKRTIAEGHTAFRVVLAPNDGTPDTISREISVVRYAGDDWRINLHHALSLDAGMWITREDAIAIAQALHTLLADPEGQA